MMKHIQNNMGHKGKCYLDRLENIMVEMIFVSTTEGCIHILQMDMRRSSQ